MPTTNEKANDPKVCFTNVRLYYVTKVYPTPMTPYSRGQCHTAAHISLVKTAYLNIIIKSNDKLHTQVRFSRSGPLAIRAALQNRRRRRIRSE